MDLRQRAEITLDQLWPEMFTPALKEMLAPFVVDIMVAFARMEEVRAHGAMHKLMDE